mgnify:CR=1 FL=1
MTVYFVAANPGPVVVRANSNDIRIIGAELMDTKGYPYLQYFYIHPSGTISGGTSDTPTAASPGAPASTATTRYGSGAAVSGGSSFIGSYVVNSTVGGQWQPYGTTFAATAAWQPFADVVIPAGSVFRLEGTPYIAVIWFEELRMSWSI